jgi:hypothetical protein
MRAAARCCVVAAAMLTFLLVIPSLAFADGLTGSATITWLYPTTGGVITTGTDNVGSVLTCPSAASFCGSGLNAVLEEDDATWSFDVESLSLSFTSDDVGLVFLPGTFNGFDFSGLTFADGSSLANFDLTTDIAGLTASDVTFGSNFIEVNLQNLPADGTFTLTLIPSPEPGTLPLLGLALIGLTALGWRRRKSASLA